MTPPARGAAPAPRTGGRGVALVLALAAAVQLVAALPALRAALLAARGAHAAAQAPEGAPGPWQPALLAARDLPPLLRDVPADARVLLVGGSAVPVAWDAHVAPRPLRVLLRVDEGLLARAAREPGLQGPLAAWRGHLVRRELALTPARLARELPRHDVVLAFQLDPAELAPAAAQAGVTLHPLATHGSATLLAVRGP